MKTLLSFLLAMLLLSGCIKTCDDKVLPESIRPFLFKQGSYWIYANSSTGTRDTFILVKHISEIKEGFTPVRCKGGATSEIFDMALVNRADTFRVMAYGSAQLYLSNESHDVRGFIFDASVSAGQCSRNDSRLCLSEITSLSIGSNTFTEVYKFSKIFTDGLGNDRGTCDLYWVKDVGVVKAECIDTTITYLELVEWNVVQ